MRIFLDLSPETRRFLADLLINQDQLDRIERKIDRVLMHEGILMANFNALTKEVTDLTTVQDSVLALLDGLSKQITDAKGDQVKLDAITAQLAANRQAMATAVVANTLAA